MFLQIEIERAVYDDDVCSDDEYNVNRTDNTISTLSFTWRKTCVRAN
jgi:hypothetical protein